MSFGSVPVLLIDKSPLRGMPLSASSASILPALIKVLLSRSSALAALLARCVYLVANRARSHTASSLPALPIEPYSDV